jgi:hypothetical protein
MVRIYVDLYHAGAFVYFKVCIGLQGLSKPRKLRIMHVTVRLDIHRIAHLVIDISGATFEMCLSETRNLFFATVFKNKINSFRPVCYK